METVKVFHDPVGNTLVVWFADPTAEVEAEETGNEVILMKDKDGKVIGFEKLNFSAQPDQPVQLDLQTFAAY